MIKMSNKFGYDIKQVDKILSKRKGRVGSKYDSIVNEILESVYLQGKLEFSGKEDADVTYIRNQVKKRIDARELKEKLEVSAIGNCIYFKKTE